MCAFHANVDRSSEAITIRQRYTQDSHYSAHESHLDITFFYGSINPLLNNIYVFFPLC